MDKNKPFYSLLNRPDTKPVGSGSKIYEWEYLDKAGNLKKDKKNVYEEIQSYRDSVDYKKLIEQGDINGLNSNDNGIYCDITDIPSNYGDLGDYMQRLGNIVDNFRSQVKNQDGKNVGQNEQVTGQVGEVAKQTVPVEQKMNKFLDKLEKLQNKLFHLNNKDNNNNKEVTTNE